MADQKRECSVGDLTDADVGRRVTFNRPANDSMSRPVISGRLVSVTRQDYLRGTMRKQGVAIRVGFPSKWGGENEDTVGPIPLHHRVTVGDVMRQRRSPWDDETIRSPFPPAVQRVRVVYVGGAMDGVSEERSVDEFFGRLAITHEHEGTAFRYEPNGPGLVQMKHGLWAGYWILDYTYEVAEIMGTRTKYRLPDDLKLPPLTSDQTRR